MCRANQSKVIFSPQVFKDFICEWVVPKQAAVLDGVILYLHGAAMSRGSIDYAKVLEVCWRSKTA
jgi:microcystin degradation protein MlrC